MFVLLFPVTILYTSHNLYILYVYDLFHILLSFWWIYGAMELNVMWQNVIVCVCVCTNVNM
jgi:hypothetical protein